jgi:hypothetical protein
VDTASGTGAEGAEETVGVVERGLDSEGGAGAADPDAGELGGVDWTGFGASLSHVRRVPHSKQNVEAAAFSSPQLGQRIW